MKAMEAWTCQRFRRSLRGRACATLACTLGVSMAGAIQVAAQTPIPTRLSLHEAVTLAIERNPEITAARAGVDAAQADRLTATRRPNPALSFQSGNYPLFDASRPGYWDNQEFTLRVDQELETAGRRRLRLEVADAGLQVAHLTARERARQVGLEVGRAYLAAVLAQADRTVAQASLDEIDRVIALNRARLEQGEISGAELRRLQVERLRFVEDVFAADLALRNSRGALLALLDAPRLDQPLELTDGLKVADADTARLLGAEPGPGAEPPILARALGARADVLAARQEQTQAETATRLQQALRTPNVTLGGGYRRDFGSEAVVFGVTVPLPLFNRNQGGIARADAEHRAATARAATIANAARLDVQRALNAWEINGARVAYIEREYLANAREVRDIVLESYRLGVADLIDFLDAQRAFRDTQRTYNRALFDQHVSRFELAAAVGLPPVQPERVSR